MDQLSSARFKNARQMYKNLLGIGLVIALITLVMIFSPQFIDRGKAPDNLSPPGPALPEQATLKDFRTALDDYEKNREPQLKKIAKADWNRQQLQQIAEYKNMALRAFSTGDYRTAVSHILRADQDAAQLIEFAARKFALLRADAADWFKKNEYLAARKSIDAALEYNISDPQALALKKRISTLPEIVPLLDKAAVAKSENRLMAERDLLRHIIRLDPARTTERERLNRLDKLLIKRDFQRAITKGMEAIDNRDITTARANLTHATRLFPKNPETRLLRQSVNKLGHDLGLQNLMASARQLEHADKWRAAQQTLQQALKMEPDNLKALTEAKLVAAVVTALQQTRDLLAQPERLTSPEVLKYATGLLDSSKKLTGLSQTLEKQMSALSRLTRAARVPVEVTILSDNKTELMIRNYGRLHSGYRQVIRLNPGSYKFEGRRAGYRSRIVTLNIPLINSGAPLQVRVIADEHIGS